ncbi:Co2+/Mg2+ efflux protein ApaG [Paraferrimonas sp. SM1919]|uniref:Co2+/Mg2+ efflux protein ApaG n=1 Tax=Paraferrimonas sp. SM1919 TaxID=2662263 RepID=UPI0013D70554|nr:Co2+/Mg2+ efflux protein ApaG [Paraferrimonas sp. SM1919]
MARVLADNIKIEVKTQFIEQQSQPENGRYVFAYNITITNNNPSNIKLIERSWLIQESNGKQQQVSGPGVVGKTPTLTANQSFSYQSGAIVSCDTATMQGFYLFTDASGHQFKVSIPPFVLATPRVIH